MQFINFISERFRQFFSGEGSSKPEESESESFENKEKIIAFSIAFFIALCLWFIVNLSRDFVITVQVPVQLTNLPDDVTLSNELPEAASVNLSGEGWKLISVYRNPPRVLLNAEASEVNMTEQVRSQIGAFSDLNILEVQPGRLTIATEKKSSKRVPLRSSINITTREQFGLLQDPVLTPDSVTITGAETIIEEITEWQTVSTDLTNLDGNIQTSVPLAERHSGIIISPEMATLNVQVTEFTEGEIRVPVRTRNLPSGSAVSYNPSTITVRFDVPISQYSEIQGTRPFVAFVDYSVIEDDDSGRVTPEIELTDTNYVVRLRSFQPQRVSYFRVLPD